MACNDDRHTSLRLSIDRAGSARSERNRLFAPLQYVLLHVGRNHTPVQTMRFDPSSWPISQHTWSHDLAMSVTRDPRASRAASIETTLPAGRTQSSSRGVDARPPVLEHSGMIIALQSAQQSATTVGSRRDDRRLAQQKRHNSMDSSYDMTSERDVVVRGADSLRGQWRAILAGSIAGLGTFALMGTLGAALGLTATAVATTTRADAGETAVGIGMGVILWTLLTALVVGVVGGSVMKHLARHDVTYRPVIFGTLNWASGLLIAGVLATLGSSGLMAAVGSASGATAVAAGANAPVLRDATNRNATLGADIENAAPTAAERAQMAEAAEIAAKTATTLAWTALAALLVGLGATIVSAGKQTTADRRSAVLAPAVHAT